MLMWDCFIYWHYSTLREFMNINEGLTYIMTLFYVKRVLTHILISFHVESL